MASVDEAGPSKNGNDETHRKVRAVEKPSKPAKSAPQRALEKLGLTRAIDLALHLPMRYEDETALTPICELIDGETAQAEGVIEASEVQTRSRRQLVVSMSDGTETLVLRFLHFYPSQLKTLSVGNRVRVRGEVRTGFWGTEMVHPVFKPCKEGTELAKTLTPVYPASAQLPQPYLRKAVASGLARADLSEFLPPQLMSPTWPSLREALQVLHDPPADVSLDELQNHTHPAWQRLKFEELLAQQITQLQARRERAQLQAPAFTSHLFTTPAQFPRPPQGDQPRPWGGPAAIAGKGLPEKLLNETLPFSLTNAQRRVVDEMAQDLARATPMHRLLQGDVGSGKTVVAALIAAIVIDHGWQCALMAPTEILAEQHLRKLVSWLEPLGVQVAWLTGSRKGKARAKALEQIAAGEVGLIVGTHAVIQDDVHFARLGLAVVDEQHRFGVQQRLALRAKLDPIHGEPHLLMMSATPIPRTLAMTLFADLDISTLDELPPGRTPVVTRLFGEQKRAGVIEHIRAEVAAGRQVYWVCPLVEESEHIDLRNATETHAELCAALTGINVGLLHGRMKAAEKSEVMSAFTKGETALLVSTTVIEVGMDVPNASLMVIEHAERFGLSQLHQLRGRVGRGSAASVCVLLYADPLSLTAKDRLKAMHQTSDGFEIARRDLQIRGPGEFLGARQSGAVLLRFADLAQDAPLVQQASAAAQHLLESQPQAAQRHADRWLGAKRDYLKA
jgi:ATP-dependent DNA helicase RecG